MPDRSQGMTTGHAAYGKTAPLLRRAGVVAPCNTL